MDLEYRQWLTEFKEKLMGYTGLTLNDVGIDYRQCYLAGEDPFEVVEWLVSKFDLDYIN